MEPRWLPRCFTPYYINPRYMASRYSSLWKVSDESLKTSCKSWTHFILCVWYFSLFSQSKYVTSIFISILPYSVEKDFERLKDVYASVRPNGDIAWSTPFILYTSCRIDARLFPFDTQHCMLRFTSWSYSLEQLNLIGSSDSTNASKFKKYFMENGIWELQYVTLERVVNDYYESG